MRLSFSSALIFLAFILDYAEVLSQFLQIPYDASTAKEGHCYTEHYNIGSMKRGEVRTVYNTIECGSATCDKFNGRFIDIAWCAFRVGPGPHCKIVSTDFTKPFPDCCMRFECPYWPWL